MKGQMSIFDYLDMHFGKMSLEPCQATREMTSELYWKNLPVSKTQSLMYLDARRNGASQESSSEILGVLLGESTMHSSGVYLNEENEFPYYATSMDTQHQTYCFLNTTEKPVKVIDTHLSWVLEMDTDPKYNLSQKAAQGILNRATKRGKALPEILKRALESIIAAHSKSEEDAMGGAKEH